MNKIEFIRQCKKNREFLEFSYKDMSNCLINVNEDEYKLFEEGKFSISKENLMRIVRVLCIEESNKFDLSDYIDVNGIDEEQINDLSNIIEELVGEVDA